MAFGRRTFGKCNRVLLIILFDAIWIFQVPDEVGAPKENPTIADV